jgi:hypothetical protein
MAESPFSVFLPCFPYMHDDDDVCGGGGGGGGGGSSMYDMPYHMRQPFSPNLTFL